MTKNDKRTAPELVANMPELSTISGRNTPQPLQDFVFVGRGGGLMRVVAPPWVARETMKSESEK